MNYTYMVKCSDGTFYTGWTTNVEKRVKAHNTGKGAKYTKTRRPVELIYFQEFETKEEAMSREYAIKQLTRKQKEQLLDCPENLILHLQNESVHHNEVAGTSTHDE